VQGEGVRYGRILLLAASFVASAALALVLRGVAYDLILIPISYIGWLLGLVFRAVSELVWWTALVVIFGLMLAWQLVPELKAVGGRPPSSRPATGQVAAVALWLKRSRTSNYFRWQLANRLGRVSRRLEEICDRYPERGGPGQAVAGYLAAGLNRSFVDFPLSRRLFQRPASTPLDLEPAEVVEYLESLSSVDRANHADSL